MPKIVFVNRYAHPDISATSQILSDIAFGLAAGGLEVSVLASRQLYDDPIRRLPGRERVSGVEIVRVATTRFGRAVLAARAIDYTTFFISSGIALLREIGPGDIVVAKTDPPLLSLLVAPIARLRGARLVNWLQDLFPEVAEAVGLGRGRTARRAYGVLRKLRNRTLSSAAANVVIGEGMAMRLGAEGVPAERIVVIPNFADSNVVRPVAPEDNPLRKAWNPEGRFVVGYSGNLGRAHDVATLLDAIAYAGRRMPRRFLWIFVGSGAGLAALREGVRAQGLEGVRFEPYQPREALAASLSVADVHLVSLRPELEGLIVPSKIYGIAAAGRPAIFIGARDGELARLLQRHGCGLSVTEGDSATLVDQFVRLSEDAEGTRAMGARARQMFESAFDRPMAVGAWRRLLDDLVRPDPAADRPGAPREGDKQETSMV